MKISTEDELQVQITHLESLVDETNDVEALKETASNLVFLKDKISGKIANLYRTNKNTHYLCRRHVTKDGRVVYGHGTPNDEGVPIIVCMECTKQKGDWNGN